MNQLTRLQKYLSENQVEAVCVSDLTNIRWLTGFTGTSGQAIVTPDEAHFYTDTRYAIQAEQQTKNFHIQIFQRPQTALNLIAQFALKRGLKALTFEPSVSYEYWSQLKEQLPDIKLISSSKCFRDLRMIKTPEEITKLKQACHLIEQCLDHTIKKIKVGVSEHDLALEIQYYLLQHNATPAFPPIVVSGKNSALPHGSPSTKKLQTGDFLTIDCGACLDGYNSDITRTFCIGEHSDLQSKMYYAVLEAQQAAINQLKPGMDAKSVDAAARKILGEHGFAEYFTHGLGHGLGTDVHDFGSINLISEDVLQPNQIWTIEPGIYIEAVGGVRIEDDVLITESGFELLTQYPKELTIL